MREEFEKLPEIAIAIKQGIYYNERDNCYHSISGASYLAIARINGAWYAYQEQQKKIEQLVDIINTGLRIEYNMNNQIHSLKEKVKLLEPFAQDILK